MGMEASSSLIISGGLVMSKCMQSTKRKGNPSKIGVLLESSYNLGKLFPLIIPIQNLEV